MENKVALHTHQSYRNHVVGKGDWNSPIIARFKEDFDFEEINE